jgi:hypothetical protein
VSAAAYQDPACASDGQSRPLVANARWIPYVIDQTYADELVPTTGVIAQAQAFDQLGQRYNLFLHAGADHLVFATEDRFGDVVTALGAPTLATNPGAFTYAWYPSLNSSGLGIGATGDYWLNGLRARDGSYGKLASIQADDAALPDPRVTPQRFGPALVTQPLPGTETGLSWTLGAKPAPARRMTLKLSDVAGLTVDAAAARLPAGTITVQTDGPTQLTVAKLTPGTPVRVGGRPVTSAGAGGAATVNLPAGTTEVALGAAATMGPASSPAPIPSRTDPAMR